MRERLFETSGKFRVRDLNFMKQSTHHDLESSEKFSGIELPDQRAFKLGSDTARQLIYAAAVGGRKAVAETSQSKRVIANAADHIFGLP